MPALNDKFTVWRVLILLIMCLSVYLYLYTNAFDGMRSSPVYHVVEGDVQAVWKDRFASLSYYIKLMKQSGSNIQIKLSSDSEDGIASKSPATSGVATVPQGGTTEPPMNAAGLKTAFKNMIEKNESTPVLTLFTTWGDTDNPDKQLVHNLTSVNWLSLRPYIIPVIFTNETNVAIQCSKLGWEVFPIRVAAIGGIPVLKFMYLDVMAAFNTTFVGYSNGDILFTNQLIETLLSLTKLIDLTKPTIIVGRRTNVANVTEDEGSSLENITRISKERGSLFTGYAEDYFITQRTYPWKDIPEVVIGRRAYDNWLVFNARKSKHIVIDITDSSLAMHQTTSAGNFEGHGHKNSNYNDNLLKKMYKAIKYNAGTVECIEQQTKCDAKGMISVSTRKVPKQCKI